MKQIMEVTKKDDVSKIALRKKVREMCVRYARESYEMDKSKSLTEWYEYFLAAMRNSYQKGKKR